jgi:VCBS repeat-containing protein
MIHPIAQILAAITGNFNYNDTDPTTGDTRTITEGMDMHPGWIYYYLTITVQSNGTYSYNVDVNNTTVKKV